MRRRAVLAGLGALAAGGCSKIAESDAGAALLEASDDWHLRMQHLLQGENALAREYARADISPFFRGNGNTDIPDPAYQAAVANGFADWRLTVGGLVESPLSLSMDNLRRLPQRTQITRHDCVEGWSAIGEWTGVPLAILLTAARLRPEARYIVFRCADRFGKVPYYESVGLVDAFHPQTILAHQLNGAALPVRNGAPLRVRIERQLGYKSAKYLTAIDAVASLDAIGAGKGGYWEDSTGYQWYAGI